MIQKGANPGKIMAIKQRNYLSELRKGATHPPAPQRKGRGERSLKAEVIKNPEDEPPFFVRGVPADSKDEYWCGLNLERIEKITGWTWEYQVPVFGGRSRSGGNVVDFLIYTPGPWTALDPQGRYWHTGANEDRDEMKEVCRKKGWRLIAWFTDQTPTKDEVYRFLKRELYL